MGRVWVGTALISLRVLDFSYNVGGIDIVVPKMRNLCNLESLDLTCCLLNGDIIESLPQCSPKLKELRLGGNNFTGALPNWIGHRWSCLTILELFTNRFTGPVPSGIGMLKNLLILDLYDNEFTGPIPSEIGMLNNLQLLYLSHNLVTGLPSEIGMLSNLTDMYLSHNNLSGVITHEHLGTLKKLRKIDLSGNSLKIMVDREWLPPFRLQYAYFASCQMGPLFPSWLQSQVDIRELDISNTSIFDRLPDWFSTTFSNATILYISNNGINGILPTNLENMTSLEHLYLVSNQLTGTIPQLPAHLHTLDVSRNYLSGPLPSKIGAPDLAELSLCSNHINGHIPESFCELKLEALNLASNRLEGEFPECLNLSMITILILSDNMMSGKLQSILKTYTVLQILDLAWNKFSGSIPSTITKLGGLFYLNLAGNNISGVLPRHLRNLLCMKRDKQLATGDQVNISVTMKGQERYYYNLAFSEMVNIDLSSNYLTGGIPREIASLDGVVNLNLSRNYLTGKIPENIGIMISLESLDLSENQLYGEIPQSLSNLTYLGFMDLSHNDLTGRIPSGGQLDTLYAQNPLMYDGNIDLCEYPIQNCSNNSELNRGDHKRVEHDSILSFSLGASIGFMVGLWVVFCVVLFKKSWRIAYFRLFDEAFDKVYVFVFVTLAKRKATH